MCSFNHISTSIGFLCHKYTESKRNCYQNQANYLQYSFELLISYQASCKGQLREYCDVTTSLDYMTAVVSLLANPTMIDLCRLMSKALRIIVEIYSDNPVYYRDLQFNYVDFSYWRGGFFYNIFFPFCSIIQID